MHKNGLDAVSAGEYTYLVRAETEEELSAIYDMILKNSMVICKIKDDMVSKEHFLDTYKPFIKTTFLGFWYVTPIIGEYTDIYACAFVWKKRQKLHICSGAICANYDVSKFGEIVKDIKQLCVAYDCDSAHICTSKDPTLKKILLEYSEKPEFPQFAGADQDEFVIAR